MKTSVWSSLVTALTRLLDRLFSRPETATVLYPRCLEDLVTILEQARENGSSLKVVGSVYQFSYSKEDIIVSLQYLDRLLGLDTNNSTVTVEPGMKLSTLCQLLASISLSLDLAGRLPDLTVADCLAVGGPGLGCGLAGLGASVLQLQVITARGEINRWNWDNHPKQMGGVMGGLGMVAVVISVSLQCQPLSLVTEISYLSSVRDVMDTWHMVHRSSDTQQLTWFPFTELVIISHTSSIDKLSFAVCQSRFSCYLTSASEWVASLVRKINVNFLSRVSMLSCMLARVQFISLWSAARYRSDHCVAGCHLVSASPVMRGVTWLLPSDCLPPLIQKISAWSQHYPAHVTSPIYIQTLHHSSRDSGPQQARSRTSSVGSSSHWGGGQGQLRGQHGQGHLCPRLEGSPQPTATLWYDWFLPETMPDPTQVSQLEDIFQQVGGVKCWTGERTVSPLLLSSSHPQYRDWCKLKLDLDPDLVLESGYVQGTVISRPNNKQ